MILKTLYVNGMIFTSNEELPYAEAMSVSLGGIDYVGTVQGLMESVGLTGLYDPRISEFEVIDLKGRTVVPGFVDADIRMDFRGGENLASKGIIGLGASGLLNGKDSFYDYLNPNDLSHEPDGAREQIGFDYIKEFPQYVSLYYPWDYIKEHPEALEDKQRLIRSRKVHVAGITIKGERYTTEEEYRKVVEFCRENSLQLSVEISDMDPSVNLLQVLMQEQSWLEDLNIPCGRVHRGESDFDPFVSLKADLIKEIEEAATRGEHADENSFFGLDSMVIGYTKLASHYLGLLDMGEIKVGNRASFLILDRDLGRIAIDELDQVHPEVTIIDGKVAYKAEGSLFELKDNRTPGLRLADDISPIKLSE